MGRAGLWLAAAAVLLVVGAVKLGGYLTMERTRVAASPSLAGFFSSNPSELEPGALACVQPVPLVPEFDRVQVVVQARRRPQPLTIIATAPGYRAVGRVAPNYPAGTDAGVTAPLRPPAEHVEGRVCIRNTGSSAVLLQGTEEPRSQVAAESAIDGERVPDLALTFFDDDERSFLAMLGTMLDRAGTLTGGLLPGWLLRILAVALVALVLAGPLVALSRAASAPEQPAREP